MTESCEPGVPALITNVQTTPATQPDQQALPAIHAALARRDLLPQEQFVDTGYVHADTLTASAEEHAITLVGPTRSDSSWQGRAGAGFAATDFQIDWEARQVQCPGGKTSRRWQERERDGKRFLAVDFGRRDCGPWVYRAQCTQAAHHGRRLTLQPQTQQQALQAARARERTAAFWEQYAARAGIEGTHSQGVRRCGLRRCRYRGQAKTHLQHLLTAVALNLVRLGAWLLEKKPARTRTDVFLRLAIAGV